MRPRIQFLHSGRLIASNSRNSTCASHQKSLGLRLLQKRNVTSDEKPLPEAQGSRGPNQESLPHVSEEAAIEGRITGEGGPDLEQSTPVQEVFQ